MTTIEIHPGEKAQILHRDGDFYPIAIPGVEFQLQAMWALTDFTDENPKGSVFFWLQSTIHGGGANTASTPCSGLFISYCLGWVRQEDYQYLLIPREVAESYPENVSRLLGYQSHGKYLGIYPGDPDGHWWDA